MPRIVMGISSGVGGGWLTKVEMSRWMGEMGEGAGLV
jgi:hypothetical protein